MPSLLIVLEVEGESPGIPGESRTFEYSTIASDPPVVTAKLNDTSIVESYFWEFLDFPKGSNPVWNDPTLAQPTFTPAVTVTGTYLIRCTINDGESASTIGLAFLTDGLSLRKLAAGEGPQFDSIQGWVDAYNDLVGKVDGLGGGVGGKLHERGTFNGSPVPGSAKHVDSVSTSVEGVFSRGLGDNIKIWNSSTYSTYHGRDHHSFDSSYSSGSGRKNAQGFKEIATGVEWQIISSVGFFCTIQGPNWPFGQHDFIEPYSAMTDLVDTYITISGFPSAANNGTFLVIEQSGDLIRYKNLAGASEYSQADAVVSFAGSDYSEFEGYENVQINSPYSQVHGRKCYVVNAPYSKTFGNAAVNIWPGSHVHSNGAFETGSGGIYGSKPQHISNITYMGKSFDSDPVDLTMFYPGDDLTGIVIPATKFKFRFPYRYSIKAELLAHTGLGNASQLKLRSKYEFTVEARDNNVSDCIIDTTEKVTKINSSILYNEDDWSITFSCVSELISGLDGGDSTGMFLNIEANSLLVDGETFWQLKLDITELDGEGTWSAP